MSGKIIILGEYFAICGCSCIAAPLDYKCEVTLSDEINVKNDNARNSIDIVRCNIDINDAISEYKISANFLIPMGYLLKILCEECKLNPARQLSIDLMSEVPIGRGLGSSTSISVAFMSSFLMKYDRGFEKCFLGEMINRVDQIFHGGMVSGVDSRVILENKTIKYRRCDCGIGVEFLDEVEISIFLIDTNTTRSVMEFLPELIGHICKDHVMLNEVDEIVNSAWKSIKCGYKRELEDAIYENWNMLRKYLNVENRVLEIMMECTELGYRAVKLLGGKNGTIMIYHPKSDYLDLIEYSERANLKYKIIHIKR